MDTTRDFQRPTIGNPLRAVWGFVKEMNRIADATGPNGMDCVRSAARPHRPETEIFEQGTDMVVRCDLTGVRATEVQVRRSEGGLTVSGRCNAGGGSFRREFSLPAGVGPEQISADLDGETLEIMLEGAALPAVDVGIPVNGLAHVPAPREPVSTTVTSGVPQEA
ncbi:Hsp20 family protein [Nocardiopsis sp. HNM0947]|uniref:Hsp20 family protein n=1 Tax=Nocardiopsis coralli TaxID=2772213 RepID=A0ABR9P521_9ACTN|nr:Hsp20/alpha crystallin family protein [Nocardiopsis coralli]MBE2998922.1 Hsp20 family protein [Nocardiopsis coralli]